MVDMTGTPTYSYESRDWLTGKATPESTLIFTYDHAENVLKLTVTCASSNLTTTVSYTFDGLNRLFTVSEAVSRTVLSSFAALGNRAWFSQLIGVAHTWTYVCWSTAPSGLPGEMRQPVGTLR